MGLFHRYDSVFYPMLTQTALQLAGTSLPQVLSFLITTVLVYICLYLCHGSLLSLSLSPILKSHNLAAPAV